CISHGLALRDVSYMVSTGTSDGRALFTSNPSLDGDPNLGWLRSARFSAPDKAHPPSRDALRRVAIRVFAPSAFGTGKKGTFSIAWRRVPTAGTRLRGVMCGHLEHQLIGA